MLPGSVVNISQVARSHQTFLANHDRAFAFILDDDRLTDAAQSHIRANAAFRTRTGHLAGSTQVRTIRTKNRLLVRFTNTAEYAAAQDSGSGKHGPRHAPYPIVAKTRGRGKNKRRGFLRFISGGQVVFRRMVMHPGVKPTHFLETARAVAFRTNLALLRAAMQRTARRF